MDGKTLSLRTLLRSFAAGELTPELFGRVDFNKFSQGLALCRNFITLPHGPAVNRPGTEFVKEVKNSSLFTRLIPFSYNNTQTFAIEVGQGYFRFHTQAGTVAYTTPAAYNNAVAYTKGNMVSSGGVNYYCIAATTGNAPPNATYWYALPADMTYEIPNPYAAADLKDIHFVQSADVITLVHPSYPPMELRRYGATNWQTQIIQMGPTISMPQSTAGTPTPVAHTYVVVAYAVNLLVFSASSNSVASAAASCSNDLTIAGSYNTVSWSPVVGATSYQVFKLTGGVYGLIATSSSATSIRDDGTVVPDTSSTPPTTGTLSAPTGVTATATGAGTGGITVTATTAGATNLTTQWYEVTAVASDGSESLPSTPGATSNNLFQQGAYNTIAWPAVPGAAYYRVYKYSGGIYGYIGAATSLSFVDDNITADVSTTPPIVTNPFVGTGNYPAAVSYYEQRRVFAGTANQPQNVWMTRSGTESNMNYSIPTRDDDRVAFRIAAREASAVRHVVPLGTMLLLTASGEWRASSSSSGPMTPSSVDVKAQSYFGANNTTPLVVGNLVLYAASRGGHVREMSYSWQANSYLSNDISLMAPHLFDYYDITDMAYSRGPIPIAWCISTSGKLLGMTYVPEQQVAAWHQHTTGASDTFEACCVVTETPSGSNSPEDMLYVVVKRTINGVQKRYVERLHTRLYSTLSDAFFVDCGATYSGAATTTVSGLTWLEGMTVNILADGAVSPPQVVTGGAITLPFAASKVQVGLPITADLQTMPVAAQIDPAMGQGRVKNVNRCWLRVYRSSGVYAGPSFSSSDLVAYKQRTNEPYGSPPNMVSDEIDMVVNPSWTDGGQVCVRQTDPLPLDIASMTLEVAIGGG